MCQLEHLIRYSHIRDHASEHRDELPDVEQPVLAMLAERREIQKHLPPQDTMERTLAFFVEAYLRHLYPCARSSHHEPDPSPIVARSRGSYRGRRISQASGTCRLTPRSCDAETQRVHERGSESRAAEGSTGEGVASYPGHFRRYDLRRRTASGSRRDPVCADLWRREGRDSRGVERGLWPNRSGARKWSDRSR